MESASEITEASSFPINRAHRLANVHEFLSFKLGNESYGIDILIVQETRKYEAPTRMANSHDSIIGVINLRGVIVPIVDMRKALNLQRMELSEFPVVIILTIGTKNIGMVVDAVSDVISLTAAKLRPVPQMNSFIGSGHILAIGVVEHRMLILLDIESFLLNPEMGVFTSN